MSSPPRKSDPHGGGVLSSPEYDVQERAKSEKAAKKKATDFHAINRELGGDARVVYHRPSITDNLIDVLTPLMIFVMVLSVVWYLLDVRFIFFQMEHVSMRIVSFLIIMGVVALNRVVAQDGSGESVLYVIALGSVTVIYSMATAPVVAGAMGSTIVNVLIVAFVWWVTNRLMHECCIDENQTAGDVGILTGTLRRVQKSISTTPDAPKRSLFVSPRPIGHVLESGSLEAVDPHDWVDPEKAKKSAATYVEPSKRLAKRHPGISIFYFATLAMLAYALGLPILLAGGEEFVVRGHLYVGFYTTAALTLLMLTSLGGLRQYFRSRKVYFPKTIGLFWLGLGSVMILMVLVGAFSLPMPSMPPMLYIEQNELLSSSFESSFDLKGGRVTGVARSVEESGFLYHLGNVVTLLFGIFAVFLMLRTLGWVAAWVGRHRDWYPHFVVVFFNRLDAFLQRVVKIPVLPKAKRLLHIRRSVAQSTSFSSQMHGEANADRDQVRGYVAHAYDAMCALAYDMGAPKRDEQTPYEFIDAFPKELKAMKKEARILTDMYVRSAYSELELDAKALDRLRQFWFTYDKIRSRYIR